MNDPQITMLISISRVSCNRYLAVCRRVAACFGAAAPINGEMGVDELRFGVRRTKGRHGGEAFGKIAIYRHMMLEIVIHPNNWCGYNRLVYMGHHPSLGKLSRPNLLTI